MWQSGACFPQGYVTRAAMNPAYWRCNSTSTTTCSASAGATNLYGATDGRTDTSSATFPAPSAGGSAWLRVALPSPANLTRVGFRGVFASVPSSAPSAATTWLYVEMAAASGSGTPATAAVPVLAINGSANYQWLVATGNWSGAVALYVNSSFGFTVTELAAQGGPCIESAAVDLGADRDIGSVRLRYWPGGGALTSRLLALKDFGPGPLDVSSMNVVAELDPATLGAVVLTMAVPLRARYLAVRHQVREQDWMKVYVWGIDAFSPSPPPPPPSPRPPSPPPTPPSPSPPSPRPSPPSPRPPPPSPPPPGPPSPPPSPPTPPSPPMPPPAPPSPPSPPPPPPWNAFAGTVRAYSYQSKGSGPYLYTPVASRGRNYHALSWDVRSTVNNPKYDTMAKTGTDAMWWLNWDAEYVGWKSAGLKVDASFQFLRDDFPATAWGANVTNTTYYLGRAFAAHFGPGRAPPNVSLDSVEFGNEPWTYNATFYSALLRGFAIGVKESDPTIRLMPCALQASNPFAEDGGGGNFIGSRIPPDIAPLFDAVNMHTYSWARSEDGVLRGAHPEHPASSFQSINNMMAWRSFNMPGKPVWVTEWGWDAALPGETCNTTLCVSQHAQAVYAIRGLMVMARKGVQVAHWFFYANGDEGSGVFTRSGLRGSNSTSFPALPVWYALRAFMQAAGSTRFLGLAAERPDVFAYYLGPGGAVTPAAGQQAAAEAAGANSGVAAAAATHLLAWRPVAAGEGPDEPTVYATVQLPRNISAAWSLSGQGNTSVPWRQVASPLGQGVWNLTVSAVPLLLVLA
ncbi:hypothetical protein TSOC_005986, partial [Tetrabaena socialis]